MNSKSNVKWVMFDVGGVLTPPLTELYKIAENRAGVPPGSLLKTFLFQSVRDSYHILEKGEITVPDFEKVFSEAYWDMNKITDRSRPIELHAKEHLDNEPVMPEMLAVIDQLKELGYKIAILTNNFYIDKERTVSWLPTGVPKQKADVIIESCIVRMRKPDKEIYELALKQMQASPSEVAFLDDIEKNVDAANEMGIKAIKFETPSQGLGELEKILGVTLGRGQL